MADVDMESLPPDPNEDIPDDILEEIIEEQHEELLEEDQATEEVPETNQRSLFPHLREISSLASWTVSSLKPGCGIAALRHPSTESFWQSDGPQPHTLTLHFAKRVKIAYMRLHVNGEQDESYTPTKIQIWAGTGYHDLLCVTEMNLADPKGWLSVDLSNAGGPSEFGPEDGPFELAAEAGEDLGNSEDDDAVIAHHLAEGTLIPQEVHHRRHKRRRLRVGRTSTLKCFLVQVRILENHQNGKDTHLRGFQVFTKDHEAAGRRRKVVLNEENATRPINSSNPSSSYSRQQAAMDRLSASLHQPDWMGAPEIR